MRKTITIGTAAVLTVAALVVWLTATGAASSTATGAQNQTAISIDPLKLTKKSKNLPVQYIENLF